MTGGFLWIQWNNPFPNREEWDVRLPGGVLHRAEPGWRCRPVPPDQGQRGPPNRSSSFLRPLRRPVLAKNGVERTRSTPHTTLFSLGNQHGVLLDPAGPGRPVVRPGAAAARNQIGPRRGGPARHHTTSLARTSSCRPCRRRAPAADALSRSSSGVNAQRPVRVRHPDHDQPGCLWFLSRAGIASDASDQRLAQIATKGQGPATW